MPEQGFQDFYNPFMSAVIIDRKANRIPLWMRPTDKDAAPIVKSFQGGKVLHSLPFVSEIRVETQPAKVPIISLTLTPPYDDGIAFLESDLIEFGESVLQVQMGYITGGFYVSKLSPLYAGMIHEPNIQIGQDISITIHATGVGGFALIRQYAELQGTTFTNKKRIQIVEEIVARQPNPSNNVKMALDATEALADPVSGALLKEALPHYSQTNKTDYQVIWHMLQDSLCWMTLENNKLRIIPRNRAMAASPKFVFSLYEFGSGADIGFSAKPHPIYPILSASSPTLSAYAAGAIFGSQTRAINGETGAFETVDSSALDAASLGSGSSRTLGAGAVNPTKRPFYCDIASSRNRPTIKTLNQVEYEKARTAMGINLVLETMGVPEILPGAVVNVRGLGRRISGAKACNYFVQKVIHTMNSSGFSTSLDLTSNVSPLRDNSSEAASNVNKQEPVTDKSNVSAKTAYTLRSSAIIPPLQ